MEQTKDFDWTDTSWALRVGQDLGWLMWTDQGGDGHALGPITPRLFQLFHSKAVAWTIFDIWAWGDVSLVWTPFDGRSRPRIVGRLLNVTDWDQCEAWLRAAHDQAELERCLGGSAATGRPSARRL